VRGNLRQVRPDPDPDPIIGSETHGIKHLVTPLLMLIPFDL